MGSGKDVPRRKGVSRRLWRVVRAVLYMLRRRVLLPSGRKLSVDLSLLLRRGKIAGKALTSLVSFHSHSAGAYSSSGSSSSSSSSSSFSCRQLDPALAVHEPSRGGRREVEFSCSTTPSSKRRGGGRRHHRDDGCYYSYDAAHIARVFEMLNVDDGGHLFVDDALATSPSPRQQQLRITDSAGRDDDEQQMVDMKADEFIRRFYEQLRAQRSVAATPENYATPAPPASLKVEVSS